MALAIPFFLNKKWAWGLILIAPCLAAQRTTTALVACAVGLIVFFRKKKMLPWLLAGGIVLASFGLDSYLNNINRLVVWMDMLKEFSVLGHGLGASVFYWNVQQVQSEVMLWVYETGIPGVILMLYMCWKIVGNALKLPAEKSEFGAAAIIFMVLCVGTIPLHLPALALLGLVSISQVI